MGLEASGPVVRPVPGREQPAVQRGVSAGGGIGREPPDLTVVDLAEPAVPLPLDPAGWRRSLPAAPRRCSRTSDAAAPTEFKAVRFCENPAGEFSIGRPA